VAAKVACGHSFAFVTFVAFLPGRQAGVAKKNAACGLKKGPRVAKKVSHE